MKVLQINSVCGVGSTGRIAIDLYKVLQKNGHECIIAYGRGNAPDDIKSIKIGSNFDNYNHVFKTRVLDKHGFGSAKATKKLIKQIEAYSPDIIHLHNIHGYYINIEILFKYLKKADKPIVWTFHDCWPFTGHCSHFDYISCEKWKYQCSGCAQKKEYPSSILLDNSKTNYMRKKELFTSVQNMTIITPSQWLAGLVKQSFFRKYPVKVINNGIDLEIFNPTKNNFREKYNLKEKIIILGVANIWNERKGLKYFIEMAGRIDKLYQIVLVGVSRKQINKLPKNIIAIARTNNANELAEIYTAADIFVNPTLEENFPTTNLEALACGTPVITFNTGGSGESVEKNCGVVVDEYDVHSLIQSISNFIRLEKSKVSYACTHKSKKQYDKYVKFSQYIKLYSSMKGQ